MAKTHELVLDKPCVPLTGSLRALPEVRMALVSGSDQEILWDCYVKQFHYLGYQRFLGHRLKYLVFIEKQPVAALSWSAPALKIANRDRFIGWSDEQRKTYLDRIANNSRFLILPGWLHDTSPRYLFDIT